MRPSSGRQAAPGPPCRPRGPVDQEALSTKRPCPPRGRVDQEALSTKRPCPPRGPVDRTAPARAPRGADQAAVQAHHHGVPGRSRTFPSNQSDAGAGRKWTGYSRDSLKNSGGMERRWERSCAERTSYFRTRPNTPHKPPERGRRLGCREALLPSRRQGVRRNRPPVASRKKPHTPRRGADCLLPALPAIHPSRCQRRRRLPSGCGAHRAARVGRGLLWSNRQRTPSDDLQQFLLDVWKAEVAAEPIPPAQAGT